MKCTTTREQLLEPVTTAEKMTGKNLTLPVLSCIHLEVREKALLVTGTNLEVGVRSTVSVEVAEEGVAAVPGSVFAQVITSLPSAASVTLSTDGGFLSVVSAGASSRIALQDVADYPTLPSVPDAHHIELPAAALRDAIQAVSFCASTSTIKPELSSVFLHPNGSVLIAAATDSFRLAEKRIPLKQSTTCEPILIPSRSSVDVVRMLERAHDSVVCDIGQHQLSLTVPGVYMTLRLTAGTFPDYTQIIPKEYAADATVLVFDIERALRRAAVFSDQFNQTTLTLEPKQKQMRIHTENASVGTTTDTVAASLSGEGLTIKFNQRYLLDALHGVATDSVVMRFAGQAQPAVIMPIGEETFRYLVMPMNR